jgi:hypothetical protein
MTAVEWIEGYLKKFNHIQESLSLRKTFDQAKEMEKQQIEQAFDSGQLATWNETPEQYYNETFKNTK